MIKKEFNFVGCGVFSCDEKKPHLPHVVSHYDTVCWGGLQNYCVGKSGVLPDGRELKIKITDSSDGNAAVPGHCRGYYEII